MPEKESSSWIGYVIESFRWP